MKIFYRVKQLYDEGYVFIYVLVYFYFIFEGKLILEDYVKLDEFIILYYFQVWEDEEDVILFDLCCRFINCQFF